MKGFEFFFWLTDHKEINEHIESTWCWEGNSQCCLQDVSMLNLPLQVIVTPNPICYPPNWVFIVHFYTFVWLHYIRSIHMLRNNDRLTTSIQSLSVVQDCVVSVLNLHQTPVCFLILSFIFDSGRVLIIMIL